MFILMARTLRKQIDKLDLRPIGSDKSSVDMKSCDSTDRERSTLRRHLPKHSLIAHSSSISSFENLNNIITSNGISNNRQKYNSYQKNMQRKARIKLKKSFLYRISFYLMKLSFHNSAAHNDSTKITNSEIQSETKALQVLVIVLITFMISWLPYCLVNLASIFINNDNFNVILSWLTYLGYIASAINPLIYTLFNKKFRKNFIDIIYCVKKSNISRVYF
jgi:hypothetical protein